MIVYQVFIASLVKDKFERHLIMMEQNGLSRFTYWTVTYIFNYTLYVIIALVITIISLIWQVRLFTQVSERERERERRERERERQRERERERQRE